MIPAGDERTPGGGETVPGRPAREQLLNVTADDRGAVVVLTVDGAVDALTVPRLRDALGRAFDRLDGRILVVDLTAVRFLGSAGLRALAEGATEATRHRGAEPLRVVVDHNRPVIRPLEIVGLDGVLALYHDVGAALGNDAPTS